MNAEINVVGGENWSSMAFAMGFVANLVLVKRL